MTDADLTLRDEVAEVLAAHRLIRDTFSPLCACERWRDKRDHDGSGHRRHVADALLPLLPRVREEGEARVRERVLGSYDHAYDIGDDDYETGYRHRERQVRAVLAEPTGGDT